MSTKDLEQRVSDLERYYVMLVEMVRRHDERLDEHVAMFREADEKIAALADAQIKTEDVLARTEDALARLIERVDKLTAALEQHTADGHGGRR